MSHYAYRSTGKRFEAAADYVVVGSGAGGATVAADLARGGADVAVVEAGAWRAPADYPTSVYGTMRDMMEEWGMLMAWGRSAWPIVQGCCVGGTTVINSAIVVRTPGDVFRLWQEDHGIDGDAMARRVWEYQDELDRELCVSDGTEGPRGRSNEMAMAASQSLGIEGHYIRRNVRDCMGSGQCLQGCRAERKQSANVNLVPAVLEHGGHVLSCAPVDRIEIQRRRATGVSGRFRHPGTREKGDRFFVRARKAVIVAASATRSPVLLARSGIRSRALGKYFRAHPGTGAFGVYDHPVTMNTGATQGWASLQHREKWGVKLEVLSLPLELVASRLSGGGAQLVSRLEAYDRMAFWVYSVRAEAVGAVYAGPGGQPIVRYGLGPRDMDRFRQGLHFVAKMHVSQGARAVVPGIHGLPYELRPDEIDRILEAPLNPRCWTAILSHLFGGCVMGADPRRSVCDPRGRVHGYQGILVADASALPSTLGVNPQHTIMAISRLRAHELLEQ